MFCTRHIIHFCTVVRNKRYKDTFSYYINMLLVSILVHAFRIEYTLKRSISDRLLDDKWVSICCGGPKRFRYSLILFYFYSVE